MPNHLERQPGRWPPVSWAGHMEQGSWLSPHELGTGLAQKVLRTLGLRDVRIDLMVCCALCSGLKVTWHGASVTPATSVQRICFQCNVVYRSNHSPGSSLGFFADDISPLSHQHRYLHLVHHVRIQQLTMSADIPPDQVAPIDGTDEGRARAAAAREAAKRKHEEVVREPSGLSKKAKKAVPRTKTSTHTVAVPEGYEPDVQRDAAVYGTLSAALAAMS